MVAGLINIYRYFAPHRRSEARGTYAGSTYRRTTANVGRNDLCLADLVKSSSVAAETTR
jgi:hypothetical protein